MLLALNSARSVIRIQSRRAVSSPLPVSVSRAMASYSPERQAELKENFEAISADVKKASQKAGKARRDIWLCHRKLIDWHPEPSAGPRLKTEAAFRHLSGL
jgi:hypothetical protein